MQFKWIVFEIAWSLCWRESKGNADLCSMSKAHKTAVIFIGPAARQRCRTNHINLCTSHSTILRLLSFLKSVYFMVHFYMKQSLPHIKPPCLWLIYRHNKRLSLALHYKFSIYLKSLPILILFHNFLLWPTSGFYIDILFATRICLFRRPG